MIFRKKRKFYEIQFVFLQFDAQRQTVCQTLRLAGMQTVGIVSFIDKIKITDAVCVLLGISGINGNHVVTAFLGRREFVKICHGIYPPYGLEIVLKNG